MLLNYNKFGIQVDAPYIPIIESKVNIRSIMEAFEKFSFQEIYNINEPAFHSINNFIKTRHLSNKPHKINKILSDENLKEDDKNNNIKKASDADDSDESIALEHS